MERTTIVAPEDVFARLRQVATERGVSLEALIHEALEEKAGSRHPRPRSLGIGDSGRTDIASRIADEPAVPEPWR